MLFVVLLASSEDAEICFTSPVIGSFTSIGDEFVPVAIGSSVSLEIEVDASTDDPVAVSPPVVILLVEIGPFTERFVNVAFVPVMLVIAKFVPVALLKKRFVKYPYTADIRLEIMFPLFWMF
jgi:hypothetical protein